MSITQYTINSALSTPTSKTTTVSKSAAGEMALLKEQAQFGGIIAGGAKQLYEQQGRAQLMQAVNEYNAAMSLENDKLRQLKEGNAVGNVDSYNTIAAKTKDKIAKKYSYLGGGQYASEFNRMTFQSAVQGRNSMIQYVNAETEKHIATEDNLSLQNQYKTVADNAGDNITMNLQGQMLKDRINLLYPNHDNAFKEAKYRKDFAGMVKSSLDASLAVNDYGTAEKTLGEYEKQLPADMATQYKKAIAGRMQMNKDLDYVDGIIKKYGSYAEFEAAVNSGKEIIPGVGINSDNLPTLETKIQAGIEDAGLAKTNPALRKGVDALNAWVNSEFGAQLTISGGWRSKEHNAEVGGSPTSHHLHGNALDVVVPDNISSAQLQAIQEKAKAMGFNSDGESMWHDKGSGYHLHLILPNGLKGGSSKADPVRQKQMMQQIQSAFAHQKQMENMKHNQQIEEWAGGVAQWKAGGMSYSDAMQRAASLCGTDYKALAKMQSAIKVFYNPNSVSMDAKQAGELNNMMINGATQEEILKYCENNNFSGSQTMTLLNKNKAAANKQGAFKVDLKGIRTELKEKIAATTGVKKADVGDSMLNSAMRIVTQYAEDELKKNGSLPSNYNLIERGVRASLQPVAGGLTYTGAGPRNRLIEKGGWFGSDEFGFTETDYERKGIRIVTDISGGNGSDNDVYRVELLDGTVVNKTRKDILSYMED